MKCSGIVNILDLIFMKDGFVLNFLWLEKYIAVSLDYAINERYIPLTKYYFWPQNDAWEDLKNFLENSKWISQSESVFLLNKLTEVINYWQEKDEYDVKSLQNARSVFPDVRFFS